MWKTARLLARPAIDARTTMPRLRGAYSLVELLMVILIMNMIASFVVVSVSNVSTQSKLDLVHKRASGALRYARMLSMSSGQPCHVDFNVTNQSISVYLGASTMPVQNQLFPGGQCAINLRADQGVSGATIGSVTNAAVMTSVCVR